MAKSSKKSPKKPAIAQPPSPVVMVRHKDLDTLLDEYGVGEVDDDHNESNGGKLSGILGWWFVVNNDGVYAYFAREELAFRFRLDEINRRLNG
jgi:hypothetical protein